MEPEVTSVVDHNAGQTSPEGDQGAPVPSATTKPVESSEEAVTGQLPEGVSERTQKEFEKLKASNAELKAELNKAPAESVYDIFRPKPEEAPRPVAPVVTPAPQPAAYTDEYGNVDAVKFNEAIAQANARAEKATQTAQAVQERVIRADQDRQEREAFAAHPALDPKSPDFDKRFYDLTRNQVVSNYATGTPTNLVDIANDIASFYTPVNVEGVKAEAVTEYKKSATKKAAAGSPAGSSKAVSGGTHEDIVAASRRGEEGSLSQRLEEAGI